MAVAGNANAIASQLEYMRPELELLYMTSSRLWSRIKVRTDIKAVSNRPARIPFEVLAGGKFRSYDSDGGDMGDGSGLVQTYGNLSCVAFLQAQAYTDAVEWGTDSSEKAVKNYVSLLQTRAMETYGGYMDAVMQGSGANDLTTVVSVVTGGIVVANPNAFQDNQDVDVYSALTGPAGYVATVTILSVDVNNQTIWLTGAVPGAVATGQYLVVSGSAGIAASGLYGLRYYQVGSNAGSYMNIQRSAFPGKFNTPFIPVNGTLTPAVVRALENQIILSMGIDRADESELVAHCNVDMQAAWENNSLLVQSVIINQVKGDESVDMLKANAPKRIGGRPILLNERAAPGLIDFLALKHWFRIESKALDYKKVDGQIVFPAYGASGGLEAKNLFYLVQQVQVGNGQPKLGAYMNAITIPAGYFGN